MVLLVPDDEGEREWLDRNTYGTWWGGALVCEPRYVEAIVSALTADLGEDEEH